MYNGLLFGSLYFIMSQYNAQEILSQLGGYDFGDRISDPTVKFLHDNLPYAQLLAWQRGVHPYAVLGQLALESDWGRSGGAINGTSNLGNINEIRENMPQVWQNDRDKDGVLYRAKRRVFTNPADFFRYKNGLYDQGLSPVVGAITPEEYGKRMYASKYAEDPDYAKQMVDMYNSVRRRMPGYEWKATQPQTGFNIFDQLVGEVNSRDWSPDDVVAFSKTMPKIGQDNFGFTDPRPLQKQQATMKKLQGVR